MTRETLHFACGVLERMVQGKKCLNLFEKTIKIACFKIVFLLTKVKTITHVFVCVFVLQKREKLVRALSQKQQHVTST